MPECKVSSVQAMIPNSDICLVAGVVNFHVARSGMQVSKRKKPLARKGKSPLKIGSVDPLSGLGAGNLKCLSSPLVDVYENI